MVRRDKRLRGELKAQIRMAHDAGNTEAAIKAAEMLKLMGVSEETAEQPNQSYSTKARREELDAIIASVFE